MPSANVTQLVRHDAGQALDVRDAVGGVDDGADLGRRGAGGLVGGDEVLQRVTDDVGADRDSSAIVFPSFQSVARGPEAPPEAGSLCLAGEPLAEVGEPGRDAAVDDVVGDLHAQAADDGGVDDRVERDLAAVLLREGRAQALGLRGAERRGGR